jgi:hypothetical protein
VLKGQIVTADTGAPIRRAQVRIVSAEGRDGRVAQTDAQGRFEIKELPAGRYSMSASKGGFVSLQYGQRRPSESGTPIELADAQTLDKLILALPRGSVLGGRITDEFGEPVANANVVAMRYAYQGGARRLMPAPGGNSRDTTDDQGHFRLFGLPPGDYYISAMLRTFGPEVSDPSDTDPSGYAPTYYPGTPNMAEATRVPLAVSQENVNISFGLIATRLVRLSGQVISSDGTPAVNGMIMLLPSGGGGRGGAMMMGANGGRLDQTGGFRIPNVAPGRYQIQARVGGGGPRGGGLGGEMAKMDLTVGPEDVSGIMLITAPGAIATGTVVSDTGDPFDFKPSQLQISTRVADGDAQSFGPGGIARVADDWSFEIRNLIDPVFIRANGGQGWMVKSVTLNSDDVTDVPVEFAPGQTSAGLQIMLTKKIGSLSGALTDTFGKPVTDATIVIFPYDEKLWTYQSRFIKAARPDKDGKFRVGAMAANDGYLAIALQGLEDGQAGDPDFLATIKDSATKFSVREGEAKTLDLKLSQLK